MLMKTLQTKSILNFIFLYILEHQTEYLRLPYQHLTSFIGYPKWDIQFRKALNIHNAQSLKLKLHLIRGALL